jgi:hypothetical protein
MWKRNMYRTAARGSAERRAYTTWRSLRHRCDTRSNGGYRYYGGRGITYDAKWVSFEAFIKDMGLPPPGMCLERIENDGNYSKDNCCWATAKEQGRNRRSNFVIEFNGERKSLTAWAEEIGIKRGTLRVRLDRGWPLERAMSAGKFTRSGKCTPNSDTPKSI